MWRKAPCGLFAPKVESAAGEAEWGLGRELDNTEEGCQELPSRMREEADQGPSEGCWAKLRAQLRMDFTSLYRGQSAQLGLHSLTQQNIQTEGGMGVWWEDGGPR